jgi:hypothetical protein
MKLLIALTSWYICWKMQMEAELHGALYLIFF